MQLRKYQIECIEKIQEMNSNDKKIVYIATGGGKTVIIASLAKECKGRVLIIVGQTELREQTIDKLKKVCGDEVSVGSVQANLNEYDKKIIVSTRQSLTHPGSKRIRKLLENGEFDIIMIDECHQAVSQVKKIIDILGNNNCKIIGFSATPFNPELKKIFNGFVYKKDILSLINEHYLCEPRCYRINSQTDISNVKTVGGEFVQNQLEEVIDNKERNILIVKSYKEYASDRKHCIVFATGIEHARNLAECFNINGIKAKSIDSTLNKDERSEILKEFKEGQFPVLVNVAILTTGFDFEALDCIIMARPTESKALYIQCIGRGLRIFEGKQDCLVLDIVDNSNKFTLLSCNSIFGTNDGETLSEKKERIKKEKEERERLLKELEEKKIKEQKEKELAEKRKKEFLLEKQMKLEEAKLRLIVEEKNMFKIENDINSSIDSYYKKEQFNSLLYDLYEDKEINNRLNELLSSNTSKISLFTEIKNSFFSMFKK